MRVAQTAAQFWATCIGSRKSGAGKRIQSRTELRVGLALGGVLTFLRRPELGLRDRHEGWLELRLERRLGDGAGAERLIVDVIDDIERASNGNAAEGKSKRCTDKNSFDVHDVVL